MRLVYENQAVPLLVETDAFEGVKRIAGKVAEDIRKVTGQQPRVLPPEELQAEKRQPGGPQENEAAELFGVKIEHIDPDYGDRLYRIDEATPFKKKE